MNDVLVNMGVAAREGDRLKMRNTGVLFFAKEPRHFFNQAYITCVLFRGTERVHIIDRKDFDGGVVADIEASLQFVERNTRTAYRIQSLRRQDIPEYPMTALREAIANAVMHRDWFMYGSNVFVEIYADRIDIVESGAASGDVTAESLGRKCARRNPLIADLLQRVGIIERAGTGIGRMREDASAHGSPEPTFEADAFFTVTFRPLRSMEFEGVGEESPAAVLAGGSSRIRAHDGAHDWAHDGAHDGAHDRLSESEHALVQACRDGAVTRDYLLQCGGFRAAVETLSER